MLVHYLNVPYPDDNKMAVITPNLALWGDKKEWTKEELVCQLKPMCNYLFVCSILSINPNQIFCLLLLKSLVKMSRIPVMKLKYL